MRCLLFLGLLAQLAVQVSSFPVVTSIPATSINKIAYGKYADTILQKRGIFPGWAKMWKPKSAKVSPAPPPPAEFVLPKPAPEPRLGYSPYGRPKLRAPPPAMTIQENNRLMANAHGVRAGNEFRQGASGSWQSLRNGGQQSMYHTKQAMNQFRQGNVRQGFGSMGLAAGRGAKGVVYSPVPLATGLYSGLKSSATSLNYGIKSKTAPPNQWVGGNTDLVRQKAEFTRTTTPGATWSQGFVQGRRPIQPVVMPAPAIGNMGLQGRPMMELNPADKKQPKRKQQPPFVPLPAIREGSPYM